MAVPFRRVSKTRRDKRRTHDKLKVPAVVVCPECLIKYVNIAVLTKDKKFYKKLRLMRFFCIKMELINIYLLISSFFI